VVDGVAKYRKICCIINEKYFTAFCEKQSCMVIKTNPGLFLKMYKKILVILKFKKINMAYC
jgi:hypothetical protein